jgi:ectoine hydroxylase-related dioxygenase (phytanoyl-CoA dioxygenase family)
MKQMLNADQIQAYQRDGILFPLPALSDDEVAAMNKRYLEHAAILTGRQGRKAYLLHPWLHELVTHPRILDAVESLLGPDLFCWGGQFFAKPVGDSSYVSWHQDATYCGLSSHDVLTAWVALTPSTPRSGCVQVVRATHHAQVTHEDRFDSGNMLTRGQELSVKVDPATVVNVELMPGQMSLHHVLLFHGSEINRADHPRIGYAIRYIPTHLRQLAPIRDSALLVRGVDKFGHFDHEQAPRQSLDAQAVACHADATERQLRIVYEGAKERGTLNPYARPVAPAA